ncbi:uncharacterized protein B0T23DRAFT_301094, partial [Neurospora hispaniola]
IIRITNEVRSEVLTKYLAIKRINFDTIVSFLIRYILLYKYIKDVKFKINEDFKVIFLYNVVKIVYPINARYWVITLEVNEIDIGIFLVKFGNIGNVE